MNSDFIIETIPGTPLVVAFDPASFRLVVTEALPDYATRQLETAWRARIASLVFRTCGLCGGTEDQNQLAQMQPGDVAWVPRDDINHDPECPASLDGIQALQAACAPGPPPAMSDMPEAVRDAIAAHLKALVRRRYVPTHRRH